MSNTSRRYLSPVPGLGLEGYADEMTVSGGGKIRFMVGGPKGTADVKMVRLIHGDPNADGPGYREEEVFWGQPETVEVRKQDIDFGSYVEVPHSDVLNPKGGFTLALWFYPTLLGGGWHTLAAKWAPGDLGYALYFAGDRFLTAAVSHDGTAAEWATAQEFAHLKCWQFIAFTYDPDSGDLCLYQCLTDTSGVVETRSSHDPLVISPKRVKAGPVHPSGAPLLLGATQDPTDPGRHWAHFTGKVGHPVLLDGALDRSGIWALAQGETPEGVAPVLGCWDLGREVTGTRVVDVSPHATHGRAVNAPGRAVTGPFWAGMPARLYTENPGDYNAIRFHEDDLEDAGWEPAFEVRADPDAKSGIYAARIERNADRLFLPFVVRARSPRCELGYLIPTLTWQAYGSNRSAYSFTEDGVLDRVLSMYNVHSDGSMVYYRTRHQPTRSWNPSAGFQHWGAHTVTANLYLIDWLEEKGLDYEVFADEDLHREGTDLLAQYRCVIMASHPEYCTQTMVDGIARYIRQGGRVVYLAGNGLYWVMSIDPERPHLVELRRSGEGDYGPTYQPQPGEAQHSTTLELGGLWARRGRPPRSIVGVEHAADIWMSAEGRWGFKRLPESHDERYAFVFEGVGKEETIGDFGLNLGSAAGFEMDAVQEWQWDDQTPEPVVLARAAHEAFTPPRRTPVPAVSEIALTTHAGGGAVFSAGSVTWTGSLSHNRYDNNVSKITENVIRRFVDTRPGASVLNPQQ